jgi:rubrerythrin
MFVFGTADDVFAMAVRIEENGKAFYSGAAQSAQTNSLKELFSDLAEMESGHIDQFKQLRSDLSGAFPHDAVWDPEGLAESYLQAAADSHVFTAEAAAQRLANLKSPDQVLEMALQFEKDSLAFFLGMKEMLPDPRGKGEIDKLIQSEMDHIRMISAAKKLLQNA